MWPVAEVSWCGLFGVCFAFEAYVEVCLAHIAVVLNDAYGPFDDVPDVEPDDEHFEHLVCVDLLVS